MNSYEIHTLKIIPKILRKRVYTLAGRICFPCMNKVSTYFCTGSFRQILQNQGHVPPTPLAYPTHAVVWVCARFTHRTSSQHFVKICTHQLWYIHQCFTTLFKIYQGPPFIFFIKQRLCSKLFFGSAQIILIIDNNEFEVWSTFLRTSILDPRRSSH